MQQRDEIVEKEAKNVDDGGKSTPSSNTDSNPFMVTSGTRSAVQVIEN